LKALAGRTNGAVCTSSNAHKVVAQIRSEGRKVLFVPDHHLGRNTAWKLGMPLDRVVQLAEPREWSRGMKLGDASAPGGIAALDAAEMILWGSYCGVHTIFRPEHVAWWKAHGWKVLVHPESPLDVVQAADGAGSTDFLWKAVQNAQPGDRLAIGTEGHFVRNARELARTRGVEVMHLTEIPEPGFPAAGCGCATMSRNDPPHLAGMLDLLRRGKGPDLNRVLAGDVVDETSGRRERLDESERATLVRDARRALERMIEITEAST
jgi:quinolinate synthase